MCVTLRQEESTKTKSHKKGKEVHIKASNERRLRKEGVWVYVKSPGKRLQGERPTKKRNQGTHECLKREETKDSSEREACVRPEKEKRCGTRMKKVWKIWSFRQGGVFVPLQHWLK